MKKNDIWASWVLQWKGHDLTYIVILPKIHNLSLIMRKHSTKKTHSEGQSQNNWPELLKNVKVKKHHDWEAVADQVRLETT